jgi:hypothetical protein
MSNGKLPHTFSPKRNRALAMRTASRGGQWPWVAMPGGDVGEVGDFLSLLFFPSRARALREF